MRYTKRLNYTYDPQLNALYDTSVALGMHDEYVTKMSARPTPRFFEVNRDPETLDPIFHTPINQYTQFTRVLDLPAIRTSSRPRLITTKLGQVYQKVDNFWVSNLGLVRADYFPTPGDLVFWNGYRYEILQPVVPPESEWGQTGVWLGLVCESMLVPYGDARFPPDQQLYNVLPMEQHGLGHAQQTGPGVIPAST